MSASVFKDSGGLQFVSSSELIFRWRRQGMSLTAASWFDFRGRVLRVHRRIDWMRCVFARWRHFEIDSYDSCQLCSVSVEFRISCVPYRLCSILAMFRVSYVYQLCSVSTVFRTGCYVPYRLLQWRPWRASQQERVGAERVRKNWTTSMRFMNKKLKSRASRSLFRWINRGFEVALGLRDRPWASRSPWVSRSPTAAGALLNRCFRIVCWDSRL